MDGADIIRVLDDDYQAQQFKTITREDITATGILRPIGARHFSKQQQDLQNIIGVFSSPIGQMVAPHTSALAMTNIVNDIIVLNGYKLFIPNIAVEEQHETQAAINQSQAIGEAAGRERGDQYE